MPTPKKKKSAKAPKKKAAKKKATKKMRPGRKKKDASGVTAIQRQFLEAVRLIGDVSKSAAAVGVSRQHHYKYWMRQPAYRLEFEAMMEEADDVRRDEVRAEIHKLGFDGWEEEIQEQELALRPVRQADGSTIDELTVVRQKVRRVKKRSITAILWEGNMLCGNPSRVEVTGKDGGPLDARISVDAFRQLAGLN